MLPDRLFTKFVKSKKHLTGMWKVLPSIENINLIQIQLEHYSLCSKSKTLLIKTLQSPKEPYREIFKFLSAYSFALSTKTSGSSSTGICMITYSLTYGHLASRILILYITTYGALLNGRPINIPITCLIP